MNNITEPYGQIIKLIEGEAAGRQWEVELIQAGLSNNGNYYPPEALKEAVPLFEGAKALARSDEDHLKDADKSVGNIVGWYTDVRFENNRLLAKLNLLEAASRIRAILVESWQRGKRDIAGLSIVATGTYKVKKMGDKLVKYVEAIQHVSSVDLVVDPAAGGRIIRLAACADQVTWLSQKQREELEAMEKFLALLKTRRPDLYAKIDPNNVNMEQLVSLLVEILGQTGDGEENQSLVSEARKLLKESRLAECQLQLTGKLIESNLPELSKVRIRRHFEGQMFDSQALENEIRNEREYLAQLSESGRVRGMGQVRAGMGEREKTIKALDGFFAARNLDGVPRFKSFREAYVTITGDANLTGQLREATRLGRLTEALATSSWAEILGDSITRRMLDEYNAPGLQEWRNIVSDVTAIRDFRTNRRLRMGGYGTLPGVSEAGDYQNLTSPGDEEATFAISKKGGLEEITLEMIANDDVGAIRRIPQKLARAAANTLYRTIFDVIATNPTIYDTKALFHADHANLGSSALAAASLLAAKMAIGNQAAFGASTEVLDLVPRYLVVPLSLEDMAYRLTKSVTVIGANNNAGTEPNVHSSYGLEVLIVPYWSDANDWALVCNPADCPTIEVGFFNGQEEPELFVQDQPTAGSMFTADKITYKIRHIYGVCVLDYRGMYKAVVA